MRLNRKLKEITKALYNSSLEGGTISVDKIPNVIELAKDPKFKKEFKLETFQVSIILKEYFNQIKNSLIESSLSITTAVKLDEEIILKLKRKYKKHIISSIIDTDIIAGIKIRSGWNITDSTIKNKFNILNNKS